MSRPVRIAHGFTLLEVLVALLIAGVVFGSIFSLLGSGYRAEDRARDLNRALPLVEALWQEARMAGDRPRSIERKGKDHGLVWQREFTRDCVEKGGEPDGLWAFSIKTEAGGGVLKLERPRYPAGKPECG